MALTRQTYRNIFLAVLVCFALLVFYAKEANETPRFVLFLGRFHPLLLHLPIGALVVSFFIDIMGRWQKNYPENTIKNLLGFTAVSAIFTCFLGYFLSLEGGYEEQTLDLHLYTAIITAVLASILFIMSLEPSFKNNKLFFPLFILSLVSISVAGHFGSVLTHGDHFLTEYIGPAKKEKTIEVVDSLRLYNDVVVKIIDKKCIQCHNNSKLKGELSLISKASILKGGVSGMAVIAGNASESLMYSRLQLPISNEEHMPPEGKEQLTKDEKWLLKHWIDNGLDFENYAENVAENDTLKNMLEKYLVFDRVEISKASQNDIEAVRTADFRIFEIVPGEAALSLKYLSENPNKESIDKLSLLKDQIVELDFSSSEITDEMTTVLKKLKNLKTLKTNSPKLTDVFLKNLKTLDQLEVLNLYNTSISNTGLKELLGSVQPKQLYTWKTNVDEETASQLESKYKIQIQNSLAAGFVVKSKLEMPIVSPKKTLFIDTIHIGIGSRLKGVDIRYTLNGKTPDSTSPVFNDKIVLDNSKTLKIAAFKTGWLPSDILVREYARIAQEVTSFTMQSQPDERYPDANKLFDLKEGSLSFKDGNWTGYFGTNLNTTIDLGSEKTVDNISFSCMEEVGSWILFPTDFIVYASNSKNGSFKKLGHIKISRQGEGGETEIKKVTLAIPQTRARYFKIMIKNHDKLPEWHPSAGNPAWLFVDEIYFW